MKYADDAMRATIARTLDCARRSPIRAFAVGLVAGDLWSHSQKNNDAEAAYQLFRRYRPLNVVSVAEESRAVLPTLEPVANPGLITESILGQYKDIIFVQKDV